MFHSRPASGPACWPERTIAVRSYFLFVNGALDGRLFLRLAGCDVGTGPAGRLRRRAVGHLGGALPGISPSIAMALLLPFTYGMDPVTGIVLLASSYVGAEYGGSIPAILISTPGTNSAAATVLDGYAMKQKGRRGRRSAFRWRAARSADCSGCAAGRLDRAACQAGAVVHAAGLLRAWYSRHQRHRSPRTEAPLSRR